MGLRLNTSCKDKVHLIHAQLEDYLFSSLSYGYLRHHGGNWNATNRLLPRLCIRVVRSCGLTTRADPFEPPVTTIHCDSKTSNCTQNASVARSEEWSRFSAI